MPKPLIFSSLILCLLCSLSRAESSIGAIKKEQAKNPVEDLAFQSLTDTLGILTVDGDNIIVANYEQGLVLVDGGKEKHSKAIENCLQQTFPKKNVFALINTHWHPAQIGLNKAFGKKQTPIYAHEFTLQWLQQNHYQVWEGKLIKAQPTDALPDITFRDNLEIQVGENQLDLNYHLQAHTDTDISVFFKTENVLAVGGIIASDRWPEIDWWSAGWFGGLLDGIEELLELANDETIIVPANGPPMSKAQLQSQYEMYTILFDRVLNLLKESKSPAEAIAAKPTEEFHPDWDNANSFVESAFRSFYGHLRGEKRMGLMP